MDVFLKIERTPTEQALLSWFVIPVYAIITVLAVLLRGVGAVAIFMNKINAPPIRKILKHGDEIEDQSKRFFYYLGYSPIILLAFLFDLIFIFPLRMLMKLLPVLAMLVIRISIFRRFRDMNSEEMRVWAKENKKMLTEELERKLHFTSNSDEKEALQSSLDYLSALKEETDGE